MGLEILTLGSSKTYTRESLLGGGAVVGKNVTISSITPIEGGNRVTFSYTLDDGTVKTSSMNVMDGIDGLPGKDGKDGLNGKDGSDGIGISKIEKIGTVDLVDTYRITFTDNSTFDYEVKNGKDGTGGGTVDVPIEKIKVNGELQTPVNKVVDITVPDAYDDTDIRAELANKADTDHTHTTVNGHTVESDVPVDAKFTDTVYDDTQIKTQIQAVANGLMDSVGYSADYKTIDIIAKNGVKKSVNVAPIISHASITELSDVDTTNKATGKALVYNSATSKHEYATISSTDEKVKMDSSTDAKYLGELLDNITIANENGELKVKKLDGQEVTITEINYLKGLTMNVMDLVNMFSNGGVKIINTPVATYAELLTLDKSSFIEGISYLVYVLADENHDNAKTTYLVDKDSETPTYFGFADSQRDFTTNPIDLATEITGKLGIANMDSDAIKALFTVDDTYKTETATNNAFSTHGAKALYDELLLAIGGKANDSDLTTHKDDTDIHVSTEDRTKWDSAKTHADSAHAPSNAQENVLETVKVNGTALTPSSKAVNIDLSDYAKKTDIPTSLPADGGNADTVNNHTVKSDVPENAVFTDTVYDDTKIKYGETSGCKNLFNGNFFEKVLDTGINYTDVDLSKEQNTIKDIKGITFATFGAYLKKGTYTFSYTNDAYFSLNRVAIAGTDCVLAIDTIRKSYTWTQNVDGWTYFGIEGDDSETGVTDTPFSVTPDIQIEEGTTATEYEPYIPSVKMLADENEQQNTEAMDLKMLGWSVPKECPIQNEVSGNQFIQRVGRVDLGSLEWTYDTLWKATSGVSTIKNLTINMYHSVYVPTIANVSDMPTNSVKKADSDTLWINNGSSTEKPSGYLYFELAEEKTISVDGNEAVTKVNDSLSVIGKCKNLLNPTLQTTTLNGVTCTANGDGTYTINGTASSDVVLELESYKSYTGKEKFRLVGCPNGGGKDKYYLAFRPNNAEENRKDIGSGVTFNDLSTSNKYAVAIIVLNGTTVTNLTFKPMLTENLNATYDDFVPYTGDGETLTHDIAKLNDSLSHKTDGDANTYWVESENGKATLFLLNANISTVSKIVGYVPKHTVCFPIKYTSASGVQYNGWAFFYANGSINYYYFSGTNSIAEATSGTVVGSSPSYFIKQ